MTITEIKLVFNILCLIPLLYDYISFFGSLFPVQKKGLIFNVFFTIFMESGQRYRSCYSVVRKMCYLQNFIII